MTSQNVLTSWKQIAAFLKREVRTVQRWETTRGLPVHRTPGDPRGVVYAFQDELTEWLRSSSGADDGTPALAFREVFMNAPEPMWLLDDLRRYREVNEAGCRLLGTTREEMLGKQIDEFAADAERRALPRLWDRFVHVRNLAGEFRFISIGGELVTTSYTARADVVPGLHLGMFRELRREPIKTISAA
jgi:PAS domain S-box-containing protein